MLIENVCILRSFSLSNFSTERIDRRLGFYQQRFDLCGKEVRDLSTKQPKLITYNLNHINCNLFIIKEEMGFNDKELKILILNKPKLWMLSKFIYYEIIENLYGFFFINKYYYCIFQIKRPY